MALSAPATWPAAARKTVRIVVLQAALGHDLFVIE
jgi:hypothetical protein